MIRELEINIYYNKRGLLTQNVYPVSYTHLKKEVKNDVNQQASEKKDETVQPDSPAPEKEQEEQVEQTSRKGRGIH